MSVPILLLGVLSNLQWAANDYGYKTISLHPRILAHDKGSDTGTKNNESSFKVERKDCIVIITGEANGTAKFGSIVIKLDGQGEASFTMRGMEIACPPGGSKSCKPVVCLDAFENLGTFY